MVELQKLIEEIKNEKEKAKNEAETFRQKMELELAKSRAFDLVIDKIENKCYGPK